jgi:hypothetical protein
LVQQVISVAIRISTLNLRDLACRCCNATRHCPFAVHIAKMPGK